MGRLGNRRDGGVSVRGKKGNAPFNHGRKRACNTEMGNHSNEKGDFILGGEDGGSTKTKKGEKWNFWHIMIIRRLIGRFHIRRGIAHRRRGCESKIHRKKGIPDNRE